MEIKNEIQGLFQYLFSFLRNPVKEIQNLPNISWQSLLGFQFFLCFASVVLSNMLAPFAITLPHVLVSLVASILVLSLSSLAFYYFFLILYNSQLPFTKIFALVLFAHIPFAIFHLASYLFPPADLIGLGISALLMIVGLVENFEVPKKLATRLMICLYTLFFVFWVFKTVSESRFAEDSSPQSLDSIEREVQSSDINH